MGKYISVFKEILSEPWESSIEDAFTRDYEIAHLKQKATILVGVRRCGKSTLIKQSLASESHKIFVNFEDERLIDLQVTDLQDIIDAYMELNPDYNENSPLHLALDEIQVVPLWEKFVDRQIRIKNRHVWITGSSSKMLSKEVSTTLRGRSLSFEIFPYSFPEQIRIQNLPKDHKRSSKLKRLAFLKQILISGSFPEIMSAPKNLHLRLLQEYFSVMLLRDILERYKISSPDQVKRTLLMLLQSVGSTFSLNRLTERLKAQGLSSDKELCAKIISAAEDCFLIFLVPIWAKSIHKQNVNPRKLYCVDVGLARSVSPNTKASADAGHFLENLVFLHLRKTHQNIYYYKTKSAYEVDFYIPDHILIQVCLDLESPETLARETRALEEAMKETGQKRSFLVCLDQERNIKSNSGTVHIVSAADFLLASKP